MRPAVALVALPTVAVLAVATGPAASRASSRVGGCPLFPRSSPWHRRVDRLPVLPGSDRMVEAVGRDAPLHADFGAGRDAGGPIGIPYVVVPRTQRRVPVRFGDADESDRGPYPIPPAPPSRAAAPRRATATSSSSSEARAASSSSSTPGRSGLGASASLARRLRRDVVAALDEAAPVRLDLGRRRRAAHPPGPGAVARGALGPDRPRPAPDRAAHPARGDPPARHVASGSADPELPAMGQRLRLKASVDLARFPRHARVVLRALREYGGIVADNGSAWFVSGAPDRHWDDDALHALSRLTGDDLEVVDTGHAARTPPA